MKFKINDRAIVTKELKYDYDSFTIQENSIVTIIEYYSTTAEYKVLFNGIMVLVSEKNLKAATCLIGKTVLFIVDISECEVRKGDFATIINILKDNTTESITYVVKLQDKRCIRVSDSEIDFYNEIKYDASNALKNDDAYTNGLNYAWNLARRIVSKEFNDDFTGKEIASIFNFTEPIDVLLNYSAPTAIKMIKDWEEKHAFLPSDIVYVSSEDKHGIVINVNPNSLDIFMEKGFLTCPKDNCVKTGKKINLTELLK